MKKYYIIFAVVCVIIVIAMLNTKNEPMQDDIPVDMSGIHIMADGTVMSPQGQMIPDAKILPNGNIQLGDGRVVRPMADYRK